MTNSIGKRIGSVIVALTALAIFAACGGGESGAEGGLTGMVRIDGSSTVFPVTEAVAEEFQIENRGVRVTVGISGTGGGSIDFAIDMPSDAAGRTYLVLISVSGTEPGTPVDFVTVPINFDAVTQVGIGLLGTPAAPGFFGTLDGNGDATATLNTPPVNIPELPGLRLQLAALTMFPADVTTNAVEVEFVP